jgi:hypothetical protein
VIAEELDRVLGRPINARSIDVLLAGGDLALSAASHIAAGEVKVTAAMLAKPVGLGFLDGIPGRDDDALKIAVVTGIICGFHPDRLVRKRAA